MIDEHDLRDVTLASLRRNVSILLQEAPLMRGTVSENIAYARPDATPEQIAEAAREAGAAKFIEALPAVSRLDVRAQGQLQQEVTEFRTLTGGVNPATGEPFGEDLPALFDTFLDRNIPNADEQWLTFVDGQLYRQKAFADSEVSLGDEFGLVSTWAGLRQTASGTAVTETGEFRYLAVPVRANDEVRGVFVVTSQIDAERDEIEAAVGAAALVGSIALLLGSLVAYLAAGRVLHPLRELIETARSIEESDLTARIEVSGNDELAELGHTFNGMLDRLEQAFGSQRELIRSVSHEMRTPITIVRGHLELLGDDPDERRETIELVTDELDRMNRLVQDLLTLARAERPDHAWGRSRRSGPTALLGQRYGPRYTA